MSEYRVLARKYRPQTFDDLVGQEALVRTLSNAIKMGRIAHAYLLTGIRGIGKTTTARIIARALNCIGADGKGGATINPCGVCPNCIQIREDRHVDVLEMDAASNNGVDDIRSLIETVHYAPTNARYKIYIIDEVHMMSNNAFNALLKTLEEPPPHVIFIMATTETRKIPVTILSRCQRFDLKRLDVEQLSDHLAKVCEKENVQAEDAALRLLAMAAEGSVRDGLSLLDRAIAHGLDHAVEAGADDQVNVSEVLVRGILGLADRTRIFALLECLFAGQIADGLELLRAQYRDGMDMGLLVQDMLVLVHTITRLCISKDDDLGPTYAHAEKDYALRLASKLSVASLSRAWQMLMKGLDEVKRAPDALIAAEMVCIRFAYMAELPDPTDLVKKVRDNQSVLTSGGGGHVGGGGAQGTSAVLRVASSGGGGDVVAHYPQAQVATAAAPHLVLAAHNPAIEITSFEELLDVCEKRREPMLYHHLMNNAAVVSFEAGEVVLAPVGKLEDSFRREVTEFLKKVTEKEWVVKIEPREGLLSLAQHKEAAKKALLAEIAEHPLTKAILESFPEAQLVGIRD